jgi:Ca2+-binding EF-hand superfamily protein
MPIQKGAGRAKLSEAQIEKYSAAFDAIDADGLGTINKEELAQIFPEDAVAAAMDKISTDGDDVITKEEFLDFTYVATLEDARNLIKAADTSGDGKLSKDELASALENAGFPADFASEVMESFDDDGSGKLGADEVIDMLLDL